MNNHPQIRSHAVVPLVIKINPLSRFDSHVSYSSSDCIVAGADRNNIELGMLFFRLDAGLRERDDG